MHSTCHDTTSLCARRYISPSLRPLTPEEAGVRAIAYAIKDETCDAQIIEMAAFHMSVTIQNDQGYLIPVPNSKGSTKANKILADAIAKFSDGAFTVIDCLTRNVSHTSMPSQCQRHRARVTPLLAHEILITRTKDLDTGIRLNGIKKIFFVDNVITSGATIQACRNVFFGLGTGLVYADAHFDAPN